VLLQIDIVRLGFSIIAAFAGFLILLELVSRWFLGLGNPLIYRADDAMGYVLAPNQRSRRFSNRVEINEYSMRSRSISRERPTDTLRILLLGDSIVNGAWWTDQDQTISSLLEKQLQPHYQKIEVLNASANSWGPRNQLAYLKHHGTFGAQIVILLMNTDDLASGIPNSQIVGKDWNYPDHKPFLALEELYQRYIQKKAFVNKLPDPGDRIAINLQAVGEIQTIVKDNDSLFLLAITPLIREVQERPKPFDTKSRERLATFVKNQNISFLDFLPLFMTDDAPATLYRDNIHITSKGNEIVSGELYKLIQENYR
jgi:hypothetical protein